MQKYVCSIRYCLISGIVCSRVTRGGSLSKFEALQVHRCLSCSGARLWKPTNSVNALLGCKAYDIRDRNETEDNESYTGKMFSGTK
jgi:hypothetical protein